MECTVCYVQYIKKPETQFNLRLNSDRTDTSRQNAPL